MTKWYEFQEFKMSSIYENQEVMPSAAWLKAISLVLRRLKQEDHCCETSVGQIEAPIKNLHQCNIGTNQKAVCVCVCFPPQQTEKHLGKIFLLLLLFQSYCSFQIKKSMKEYSGFSLFVCLIGTKIFIHLDTQLDISMI